MGVGWAVLLSSCFVVWPVVVVGALVVVGLGLGLGMVGRGGSRAVVDYVVVGRAQS